MAKKQHILKKSLATIGNNDKGMQNISFKTYNKSIIHLQEGLSMEIFCDCSFDSKNKVAGIGLLIKDGVKQKTISNWIQAPDNNFGEIWAVYQAAILMGGRDGVIYTDSQTALAYIQNKVKDKPRTREQYENHQRMRLMGYKIRKLKANVEWTRGHVGNFQQKSVDNTLADCLAKQGRSKFYRSRER